MPTTPAGNVYTIHTGTHADGGTWAWYVNDDRMGDMNIPLLLFAHGSGGSHLAFQSSTFTTLRNWLIDQGWAVAESDGAGTHSWGGPSARLAYTETYDAVSSALHVGDVTVMGNSMGGIVTYWMGARSPFAHKVKNVILHQAATDLIRRYDEKRALAEMNAAYGLPDATYDPDAFAVAAADHDPMQFAPAVWNGKHVLHLYGTEDTVVPWDWNGAAWITKYGDNAASVTVHSVEQGHTLSNADQLHVIDYLAAKADEDTPREPVGFHRIKGLYVVANGRQLYPVDYGALV